MLFPLLSAEGSKYDFTIYETADNSVMGVKGDKLGLDVTGYGFIGQSKKGFYIRLGLQTPFDTILGYLNLLPEESPTATDSEEKEEEKETSSDPSEEMEESEMENRNISILSPSPIDTPTFPSTAQSNLSLPQTETPTDINSLPDIPPAITNPQENPPIVNSLPDTPTAITNPQENPPVVDDTSSPSEKTDEEEKPLDPSIPITGSEGESVVSTTKSITDDFRKEWRFLLTIGPAYRSFMGEEAMVYLGYGISGDFGHRVDVDKDTGNTVTSSHAILGGDVDMGLRYTIEDHSTIRIGAHFTTDFIGFKSYLITDEKGKEVDDNTDFYGYSLTGAGIFETMKGQGYIRLALALNGMKKEVFDYSNRTGTIGGGTIQIRQ